MARTDLAWNPLLITVLALVGISAPAAAEKADSTLEELRAGATHVLTGTVESVTAVRELEGPWEVLRYHALVHIQTVEKGTGIAAGDKIGCRYWTKQWFLPTQPPPDTSGHGPLPRRGQAVRVHVVDKGYNGFGHTTDGGFDVLGRNGWQLLSPVAVVGEDAPLYDALNGDWRRFALGILAAACALICFVVWFLRRRKLKHA